MMRWMFSVHEPKNHPKQSFQRITGNETWFLYVTNVCEPLGGSTIDIPLFDFSAPYKKMAFLLSATIYLPQALTVCLPIFFFLFVLLVFPWFLRRLVWPYLLEPIGFWPINVVVRKLRPFLASIIVATLCYVRVRSIFQLLSSTDGDGKCVSRSSSNYFKLEDETSILSNSDAAETVGLLDAFTAKIYHIIYILFQYACNKKKCQGNSIALIYTVYKILINDLFGLVIIHSLIQTCMFMHRVTWQECKASMITSIFEFCQDNIHLFRNRLQEEENKMRDSIQSSLKDSTWSRTLTLPNLGRDHSSIIQQLTKYSAKENRKWKDGYVSGTVYVGGDEHSKLLTDVYQLYSLSNPLHPDVWPSVNQLEAEVCSMTASLVNGGNANVCGCISSGGTESIVLAVKAHRQYFGQRRGIKYPEIISCLTAHAGLDKACELLGIRNVRVPSDPKTFQIDWKLVERYITANTIMIYASAPCYPQGVIDPIVELSSIALKYQVGLHVDCCLGGFVLPFARRMGYSNIPVFDFSLPGVTSMSLDTHKYGYAAKGSSVVLYRDKNLRRAQYFCYADWTGGLYATPTLAGSRSGALVACAWASLIALGEAGFRVHVQTIMDASRRIAREIGKIKGLVILGSPQAMVVCFTSYDFNIYSLGDAMSTRGWSLNSLQNPACIHICVTLNTAKAVDNFLNDLRELVALMEGNFNAGKATGNAAVYGMASSLPKAPVDELLKVYNDVLLTP